MMNSMKSQNTLATPLIAVAIIRQKNQSKSKTEEKEQLLIKSSTDHPRQSSPLSNTISPKVDLAVVIFWINTNTTCLSMYCSLSRSACVGSRYKSPTCLSAKDEKIRWWVKDGTRWPRDETRQTRKFPTSFQHLRERPQTWQSSPEHNVTRHRVLHGTRLKHRLFDLCWRWLSFEANVPNIFWEKKIEGELVTPSVNVWLNWCQFWWNPAYQLCMSQLAIFLLWIVMDTAQRVLLLNSLSFAFVST